MDKRTANHLTRRIPEEVPFIDVKGLRARWILRSSRNAHSWDVNCLNKKTGETFVIRSREDWEEKKKQLLTTKEA